MLNKLVPAIQKLSPELRKIVSNIGWLFADRILRMGVGLIVTAWIARYLGPQQFGLFNYAIAFVYLFSTVAKLGLDQIVVRNIVRDPFCKEETLGTAFALKLISGTAAFLLAAATIFLLRPDDPLTRWVVVILSSGIILEAFNTIDYWFQSQIQSKYTVWATNTAFIITTLVRIALLQMQAPLIAFAWVALLEGGLGSLGLLIGYKLRGQNLQKWRVNFLQAKSLIKESWPLIISAVAIMIYVRIDMIMLGELIGDRSVGIYSVTTRISELWYFIPSAIVNSVNPSILEAKRVSETLYYNKLQKLFNIMAILAYSVALPMTFLSTYLVVLIFGKNYAAAGGVLAIHIWAALFVSFGWAKGIWIIAEGFTMYALISTCLGALMNIILNLWLIPIYQETGAAIATVISYGFTDYCFCLIYPPARKLGWIMTKALTLNFFYAKKQVDLP